jgi:hypothetical protein
MQVNICHRLLKNRIEKGEKFIDIYKARYINSDNIPKGLYATRSYAIGEIVLKLQGKLVLNPTRESIHIGNGMHVIDKYGEYINHSFEPNTRIVFNKVTAIKEIKQYEEITFDYNETEINMAEPFEVDGIIVRGEKI